MKNKTMPNLPKATFTEKDHSKIRMAMVFHDPMKEMLNELWNGYFDGLHLKRGDQIKMANKLKELVEKVNRFQ